VSRFIVEPIGQYAVDQRQVRLHYNGQEFELHLVILLRHRRLAKVDYMPYKFRQINEPLRSCKAPALAAATSKVVFGRRRKQTPV
jgi:hypothetical protein